MVIGNLMIKHFSFYWSIKKKGFRFFFMRAVKYFQNFIILSFSKFRKKNILDYNKRTVTYCTFNSFKKTLGWFEDSFLSENYYTRLLRISGKVDPSRTCWMESLILKRGILAWYLGRLMFKEWIGISCTRRGCTFWSLNVLERAAMYIKYTQEYKYTMQRGSNLCNVSL